MVFVSPVEALSGIHRFGNTRLRTLQCRLKSRPFQIEIFRKTKTVCKKIRSELCEQLYLTKRSESFQKKAPGHQSVSKRRKISM